MPYITLQQASLLTGEKPGTIYQRIKRAGVNVSHEQEHTKGYRNRVLIPMTSIAILPPRQASIVIRSLLDMPDETFTAMGIRAINKGVVPRYENRDVRVRYRDGKTDTKNLSIDRLNDEMGDAWEELINENN
jgi:hypothetical protein